MASVNYKKYKTSQQAKAMFRHCDKEERLQANHSNVDINKAATPNNMQGTIDYDAACRKYDERIASLDSKPGANKRKDRVTCFGLNVPAPKDLKSKDEKAFFMSVVKIISKQYGAKNIIQYYMHQDEKHEYINSETGERCMSRAHLQCYVIPERNEKLNGKWFSSKANMVKLNNAIHEMALEKFGIMFMDGSKKKSRKTVEQLKNESTYLEAQQELDAQKNALDARQTALSGQEAALHAKAEEMKHEKKIILKSRLELSKKEEKLTRLEADCEQQLRKTMETRDMAAQLLRWLEQIDEEDRQLIELGKKQRHKQRASMLDEDSAVQAYHELNKQIESLLPKI